MNPVSKGSVVKSEGSAQRRELTSTSAPAGEEHFISFENAFYRFSNELHPKTRRPLW